MERTVSETIKEIYGNEVTVTGRSGVYGGDINESYALELSNGERVFLKMNQGKPEEFFIAEAEGLRAIEATGTIGAAHVLGMGTDGGAAYLLLEYIEKGYKTLDFWSVFGCELAHMHKADTSSFVRGKYGFSADNYIGATRQINTPCDTWIDFFRTRRLEFQFKLAWDDFDESDRSMIMKLLDKIDALLIDPDAPSLIHGDLWGGNFMTGEDGKAVLIDPAVYVGCAEADIAMTELFGGFAPQFYDAYRQENPFEPGYSDRRDLYNLYHLLNHLNLFGGSYYGAVMRIVRHYAG